MEQSIPSKLALKSIHILLEITYYFYFSVKISSLKE
jgi:hypothetical protein